MKKIATVSILIVLAAFWTYPSQASKVVYFAPDGSEINRAEYDRLAAEKENAYQHSKKSWRSKPFKKSFASKMRLYVGDYEALMDKIETKQYQLGDLRKIVAEYNQWFVSKFN